MKLTSSYTAKQVKRPGCLGQPHMATYCTVQLKTGKFGSMTKAVQKGQEKSFFVRERGPRNLPSQIFNNTKKATHFIQQASLSMNTLSNTNYLLPSLSAVITIIAVTVLTVPSQYFKRYLQIQSSRNQETNHYPLQFHKDDIPFQSLHFLRFIFKLPGCRHFPICLIILIAFLGNFFTSVGIF